MYLDVFAMNRDLAFEIHKTLKSQEAVVDSEDQT